MIIKNGDVTLRDMVETDISDYVAWFTKETDWQNYDAPWEMSKSSEIDELKSWSEYYISIKDLKSDELRWKFEIEYKGLHVGWVSSYLIDEDYEYISYKDSFNKKTYRAIGIDICNPNYRGKGIGKKALSSFIKYYFDKGEREIYTQTWSGNFRMINLANSLGFSEIMRKKDYRIVNNKKYDGLTFILKK